MKFKNKGRKIYKTKEKNYYSKNKSGKITSVFLSLLLLGGIVFIGYSVAEPILNYTKKKGDSNFSSIVSNNNNNNTTETENTENSGGVVVQLPDDLTATGYNYYFLDTDSLLDSYSLKNALEEAKLTQTEYVVVPLKISGGSIYYSTQNNSARLSGAVSSYLTLEEIVSEIKASELKPVAYMSVLYDNIYPETYPDSGYRIAESGSVWLDNSPENGGKPWLNPFTDEAVEYAKSLAEEITSADFERIIFSDIIFPPLRQSDLEYIGITVQSNYRYTKLTDLANELISISSANGTPAIIEVSALDIAEGDAEVLKPELLSSNVISVNINLDELYSIETSEGIYYEFAGTPAYKINSILDMIKSEIESFDVMIHISGESITSYELEEITVLLKELGYNYII